MANSGLYALVVSIKKKLIKKAQKNKADKIKIGFK